MDHNLNYVAIINTSRFYKALFKKKKKKPCKKSYSPGFKII